MIVSIDLVYNLLFRPVEKFLLVYQLWVKVYPLLFSAYSRWKTYFLSIDPVEKYGKLAKGPRLTSPKARFAPIGLEKASALSCFTPVKFRAERFILFKNRAPRLSSPLN